MWLCVFSLDIIICRMDYRYVKSINNTTTILRMCVVSSIQIVASIYLQRSKYVTNSVSDVIPVDGLPPSTAYYTNNPPLCAQCDNIFININVYLHQQVKIILFSVSVSQYYAVIAQFPLKTMKKTGLAQSATWDILLEMWGSSCTVSTFRVPHAVCVDVCDLNIIL